jgi:hypothetical protein
MTFRRFSLAPFLIVAACLCASTAFADNLTGQASIIDGDTLERLKAISFAVAMTAFNIVAGPRLRMTWIRS